MKNIHTKIITFATSKGGTGKSTLARNFAAYWVNIGLKIAIIDADPQGSIINRHNLEGLLKDLTVIAESEENITYAIDDLKGMYNYIIIDTGGFRNKTTIRALVKSDLAIIPLKPSSDDVNGAIETCSLVKDINNTPERLDQPINYSMIITMSQQNTVIARHVRSELEAAGYLLLRSEMYHRVAYPEAAINGLSPCIVDPEGAAARDIGNIINELNNTINY